MHMKYLHSPQTTPKTNINNLHVITHIIYDNPKRRLHTNNCHYRGVFDLHNQNNISNSGHDYRIMIK